VNVGSVAGIHAAPWSGLYSSTKGAVHRLSDALRLELKGFGVDVLVIARESALSGQRLQTDAQKQPASSRLASEITQPAISKA
jgi:short-subunit dehydrogenase